MTVFYYRQSSAAAGKSGLTSVALRLRKVNKKRGCRAGKAPDLWFRRAQPSEKNVNI